MEKEKESFSAGFPDKESFIRFARVMLAAYHKAAAVHAREAEAAIVVALEHKENARLIQDRAAAIAEELARVLDAKEGEV